MGGGWSEGEPLWKRAPRRDENGRAYTDFLMLAPGLKKRSDPEIEQVIRVVEGVLARFGEWVVFAEINLKLSTLWVSMRYRPGLMSVIVAAVREQAPEFKLVGHDPRAYPSG